MKQVFNRKNANQYHVNTCARARLRLKRISTSRQIRSPRISLKLHLPLNGARAQIKYRFFNIFLVHTKHADRVDEQK